MTRVFLRITLLVLLTSAMTACNSSSSSKAPGPSAEHYDDVPEQPRLQDPDEESLPAEPIKLDLALSDEKERVFLAQPRVENFPSTLNIRLVTESSSFSEPMSFSFDRDGLILGRSNYQLKKIFLGDDDDPEPFFFGQGDDIRIIAPWKVISLNLKTFTVFGGDQVGEGQPIGFVNFDSQGRFSLELFAPYFIDKNNRSVVLAQPHNEVRVPMLYCPELIEYAGQGACNAYVGIYNALSAIDFKTMGAVGPGVAEDILQVKVVVGFITSYFAFEPDVDSIRENFLIPMLKTMAKLKRLHKIKEGEKSVYLEATREAYADLIIVSMDSVIKIQKMAPEAFENLNHLALGSALAYLGAEQLGDKVISKKQPKWFQEIVAPVIREAGILSIDLILNGSKTPLETRIQRFVRMEAQVHDAVTRLCKKSRTKDTNQCLAALEQYD